jgi:hypothetical protein
MDSVIRAAYVRAAMDESWWSIEVLHGPFSADRWKDSHGSALIEAAIAHGSRDWSWRSTGWGVVLEISFADLEAWAAYRLLPGVQAALDAVPDRVAGLFVYRGRGGSAAVPARRPPRPPLGAGAAPLPVSLEPPIDAHLAAFEPEARFVPRLSAVA